MRIPKKLKIGGHNVAVELTSDETSIGGKAGQNWTSYNKIKVNKNIPKSQQEVTLLHEIFHNILNNLGYKFSKDSTDVHSEKTVESLSQAMYQVMKDNKLYFGGDKK